NAVLGCASERAQQAPPPAVSAGSPTAATSALRHAQAPAVLDHSRTLPQGDGGTGPAFAGGAEGDKRNLIVLDAGDVLDNALAVGRPGIDAEGEVISRRGHLRPLLPQSASASIQRKAPASLEGGA